MKDNERIEHLSTEEVQRFLDTARTWPARDVGNMLMLAFFTGMRSGEIFKLEDRDVDFELKLIRLRKMLTHKNADFTKKIYAQFLPETLSVASNVAADILLRNLEK